MVVNSGQRIGGIFWPGYLVRFRDQALSRVKADATLDGAGAEWDRQDVAYRNEPVVRAQAEAFVPEYIRAQLAVHGGRPSAAIVSQLVVAQYLRTVTGFEARSRASKIGSNADLSGLGQPSANAGMEGQDPQLSAIAALQLRTI